MSLPGLELPGLTGSSSITANAKSSASLAPRTETLAARAELGYITKPDRVYTVKLLKGSAEVFGSELAPHVAYDLSGTSGAIYTWHGCTLELTGEAESEWTGTATESMVEWLNIHGLLEDMREDAAPAVSTSTTNSDDLTGPRVLVIGPNSCGKSSLVRCLASWSLKSVRTPCVVNLDPQTPMMTLPGALSAVVCNTALDPSGWGAGPTTAESTVPDKQPLIYHFPFAKPDDNGTHYRSVVTRMALSVTQKMEQDASVKMSGLLIDSPAGLNQPKDNYALLQHVVSEFSINVILVMGSERLYSDVSRRYGTGKGATGHSSGETINVLRVASSSGAVAPDAAGTTLSRAALIKRYFFESKDTLHPKAYTWDFNEPHIFRAVDPVRQEAENASFLPPRYGGANDDANEDEDDDYDPASAADGGSARHGRAAVLEKCEVSAALSAGLLAIKFAAATDEHETIRDSAVVGFAYVADVDETKRKIRVLFPHPGKLTDRAMVWSADFPEAVADLAL